MGVWRGTYRVLGVQQLRRLLELRVERGDLRRDLAHRFRRGIRLYTRGASLSLSASLSVVKNVSLRVPILKSPV